MIGQPVVGALDRVGVVVSPRSLRWIFVWLIGLGLCGLLAWQQQRANELQARQRLDELTDQLRAEIETRMSRYVYGLRGARGAVIGAGGAAISRQRFLEYSQSRRLENEFPGSLGFGFIRRVARQNEARFVAAARQDGWPGFRIRQLTPHDGERLVIQYIEPVGPNLAAVGLDIASEANRYGAAQRALRSGEVSITGPILLVQSVGQLQPSVLLMLPVYRADQPIGTDAQRLAAGLGLTYTPLELASVLRGLEHPRGEVALWLDDLGPDGASAPLYASTLPAGPVDRARPLRRVLQLPMYGRLWRLTLQTRPAFRQALHQIHPGWLFAGLAGGETLLLLVLLLYRHSTERQRQLRRQRARLAAIVDSSTDAMIVQNGSGLISAWNPGAQRMFGFGTDIAIGSTLLDLVVPDADQADEASLLRRVMQGETVPSLERALCHQDGRLIPVTESVTPLRDERGRVIGVARVVRDISEQKAAAARIIELNEQLEQRLRDQGQTLELVSARERLLFDNALSSVIVTDAEGRIVLFNSAAERLLGYRADEVIGQAVMTQFHDSDEVHARVKALASRLGRYLEPGEIFQPDARSVSGDNNEWLYVHRDGRRIPVLLTVGMLRGEAGELRGFIGIASDLTERKRLEAELHRANELALRTAEAEAANEAKSLFLAHMSHEIRTPLNAVIALTYLLQLGSLSAEQRDLAEKIRLAGLSLLAIVNDVLDLSKIEAGEMKLDPQPFSLRQLLQQVRAVVHGEVQRKGLSLQLELPAELPDLLLGDGLRLRQVIDNLLGNAVKFTEAGSVGVRLAWTPVGEGRIRLTVAVRDTGPGIDAATCARLFQPFTQADASITRRYGGTGLGLSIARRLVGLMGGMLELDSEPGRGSEFHFAIELALADPTAVPAPTGAALAPAPGGSPRLPGVRVLLVDDSSINREVGQRVLAHEGAEVRCAGNGAEALAYLERHAEAVDVVLMDLQMPEMDGFAAARQIRQQLGLQRLPVLALTAQALQSEHERARAAGMDDFILKPIDPDLIVTVIARHVGLHRPAPEVLPARPPEVFIPPEWPDVAGLDRSRSAHRLSGDVALLERLLRRFIDTEQQLVEQIGHWPVEAGAAERQTMARHLHRLRGSAGVLGLDELGASAAAAERLLDAQAQDAGDGRAAQPDAATIRAALQQLAADLGRLCQALQPWLAQRAADRPPPPAEPLPPELIDQLLALLAVQDFSALRLYERWQSALAARLPADAAQRLSDAMRHLDLPTARAVLHELQQQLAQAPASGAAPNEQPAQ